MFESPPLPPKLSPIVEVKTNLSVKNTFSENKIKLDSEKIQSDTETSKDTIFPETVSFMAESLADISNTSLKEPDKIKQDNCDSVNEQQTIVKEDVDKCDESLNVSVWDFPVNTEKSGITEKSQKITEEIYLDFVNIDETICLE